MDEDLKQAESDRYRDEVVRATTPIDERLNRLNDLAERCANITGSLDDRLVNVLSPRQNEIGRALEARAPSVSPLAQRLDSIGDLFELEIERLGELRSRLEV